MSSAAPPLNRGHCIYVTDLIHYCRCLSFAPHASPLQDRFSCATCGHGIHAHVDYISAFVHRSLVSHCAAYAQRTLGTQECTCMLQLVGHTAVLNPHRSTVLYSPPAPFVASSQRGSLPSHMNIPRPSGGTVNSQFAPVELISSRGLTVPDPYHPTDWSYRVTFFTSSEAVSSDNTLSSSSGRTAGPLYAPRLTYPSSTIDLSRAYTPQTQTHSFGTSSSGSLDGSAQHQGHMVSNSDYGIRQTGAADEGSTVYQDYQMDDVVVQSDDEKPTSSD
ncbi:uncharacterized protein EV420DRAFT_1750938 [Desarmillaria tabescens]|uniref:Uncharacterized protein n=1 Tax=Armillaria tabescens TaxID=1929756 RepID=A0AA39MW02_ARMTA|nr:uncharacterized protein EV420DRAFT_1750938 [Desarmillaria tabescens]KAK0448263.1 hypothetical protein EV420DRAFT_1750938 [Desarmillaria tabescens]